MQSTTGNDRERTPSQPPQAAAPAKLPSLAPPQRIASPSKPPPIAAAPVLPEDPDTNPVPKQHVTVTQTEDSGLHDIRSLAQSTKQRLSRRQSTSPVATEDEHLAASSAALKAVALPAPAKMVSLPELEELPSKKEILAKEKAAAKAAKAAPVAVQAAPVASAVEMPVTAPVAPAVETSARFASFQQRSQKKSKAPIAIIGALVAAAAGVAIYMATAGGGTKSAEKSDTVAVAQAPAAATAPVQQKAPEPPPPPPAPTVETIDQNAAAAGSAAAPAPVEETKVLTPAKTSALTKKAAPVGKSKGGGKVEIAKPGPSATETAPADKGDQAAKKNAKGGKGSEEGEPSFDALLKEAGVDQQKKPTKPKLDKKQLDASDFKKGMAAVSSKAQACYKGTQGTASFKVAISPSGQVTGVTMTGQFAGKPEGACVEAAVKSASFPAWDGNPQSFVFSYLLAE